MSKKLDTDLDYLPPRAAALVRKGHVRSYHVSHAVLLFFILLVIWSYFAELHEITKANGKIISASHHQTINNLEGGIVKEILAQEGQIVQKGQILMRLDKTMVNAKYAQDTENYYRYFAAIERLQAQIQNQPYSPSQTLMQAAPAIANEEQTRYQTNINRKMNEVAISTKEVETKKQEIAESIAKHKSYNDQYKYTQQQMDITKPLAEKKIYSQLDFIKVQRDMAEQKAQLDLLKVTQTRQKAALAQAQERLKQIQIRFQGEDLQELREMESKLAEATSSQLINKDRMMRTDLRAPMRGIVREKKIHTVGAVIQPGEIVMDIEPLDDTLLVEVKLAPSDVGFVHVGMPATIKMTAYDFGSYGGLDANVIEISPDAIQDKQEQSYYRVMLRTKTNALVKNGKFYPITPGMQLEADMLTGKKSVLKYFMKPFLKALQNAMTEK